MKYLRGRLIKAIYVIFNRGIRHRLKVIAKIFTHSLTWLSILRRLFSRKYNSLWSCFCKIEIMINFAFNEKYYTYAKITEL